MKYFLLVFIFISDLLNVHAQIPVANVGHNYTGSYNLLLAPDRYHKDTGYIEIQKIGENKAKFFIFVSRMKNVGYTSGILDIKNGIARFKAPYGSCIFTFSFRHKDTIFLAQDKPNYLCTFFGLRAYPQGIYVKVNAEKPKFEVLRATAKQDSADKRIADINRYHWNKIGNNIKKNQITVERLDENFRKIPPDSIQLYNSFLRRSFRDSIHLLRWVEIDLWRQQQALTKNPHVKIVSTNNLNKLTDGTFPKYWVKLTSTSDSGFVIDADKKQFNPCIEFTDSVIIINNVKNKTANNIYFNCNGYYIRSIRRSKPGSLTIIPFYTGTSGAGEITFTLLNKRANLALVTFKLPHQSETHRWRMIPVNSISKFPLRQQ